MAELVLETPEGNALRFELAGPGARILSAALDLFLFVFGATSAFLVLALLGLAPGAILLASGAVLLLVGYWVVSAALLAGSTPGKLACGLRVSDLEGFAPAPRQHLLRALFVPLEVLLVTPVPLTWLLIALTPRHQRLGDLVAGTVVLRARAPRAAGEPAPGQSWSSLATHAFPLAPGSLRGLGPGDLAFLRALLTRADLTPEAELALALRTARHYARRLGLEAGPLLEAEPRRFVRELFLALRERLERTRAAPVSSPAEDAAARGNAPGVGSSPR